MAYIVPRAMLVVLGWILTCGLIATVSHDANLAVFCFTGLSWGFAGVVCFGYVGKLRRSAEREASFAPNRAWTDRIIKLD